MTTGRCGKCDTKLRKTAEYCHVCGAKVRKRTPASRKSNRQIKVNRLRQRRVIGYSVLTILAGALLLITALAFSTDRGGTDPLVDAVPDAHDEMGIPYPEVPRISLQEAKERYDSGQALFLDVRSSDEYEMEHISSAISMPLADLETRYRDLPREVEILTYCT